MQGPIRRLRRWLWRRAVDPRGPATHRSADRVDLYFGMGPFDPPQDHWLIAPGGSYAHLYAYADPGDDPDLPRCGESIHRSTTRRAVHGDRRCPDCEAWYEHEVWMIIVA